MAWSSPPLPLLLPSSPLHLSEDRFSLTDSDGLHVPSWSIISALFKDLPTSPSQLIEHLDIIAVTFRDSTRHPVPTDFVFLQQFLDESWDAHDFVTRVWPALVSLALEMPSLFPENCLPALYTPGLSRLSISRRQTACLVVHQFLCTIPAPSWLQPDGSPDFHIWYASGQPHPRAVHAYLYALFTYFERIATHPSDIICVSAEDWPIIYSLVDASNLPLPPTASERALTKFTIRDAVDSGGNSTDPSLLGLPDGASVISANRYVGFGRTGTQEEVHVGCSPEASVAVLVTPPLTDKQILVVRGAEAIVVVSGRGRDAHLACVLPAPTEGPHSERERITLWRTRTMLFMDALDLDHYDTTTSHFIPDLLPGHLDRELTKAYTAFNSAFSFGESRYREIVTGLWGCGTFCGNKQIKTILQWCAASLACVPCSFVACSDDDPAFVRDLEEFVVLAERERWTAGDVLDVLYTLDPTDEGAKAPFRYVGQRLAVTLEGKP